jgi:hypothetical protein
MSQTSTPTSTTQQKKQFVIDSEKRDTSRFSSLSGGMDDETGSRNSDFDMKRKTDEKCSNLLSKPRGKNIIKSPFGAHKGIGTEDVILDEYDQLDKLQNWGEFQNLLDDIKERKAQHRIELRQAQAAKQWMKPSPYASYPAEAMENLAEIVGLRNRGIKFTPDLNAANTAQMWLNKKG